MSNITREFLDELLKTQNKLKDMHKTLCEGLSEHNKWKADNIGALHHKIIGEITNVEARDDTLYIETFGFDSLEERLAEFTYRYSLNELLDPDWREKASQAYEARQLELIERQRLKDIELMQETERKEREELARLKAKYEAEQ